MPAKLDLRRLEIPVVQAGMGRVARHELAAAVSEAGGLGTIAGAGASIAAELAAARRLTGRPLAVNLLLPFLGPGDREAASEADLVVTFWGRPERLAGCAWVHQCGSVDEARAAAAAGADGVIAQGVESGGHVRGTTPRLELLEQIRAAVEIPVLLAGGIATREDVAGALEAGAVAAVAGTRFLMSAESRAHPDYKRRCQEADRTIRTELFGLGWPAAPHRVIPNEATGRWLGPNGECPGWVRRANGLTAPLLRRIPPAAQVRAAARQRVGFPLLGPAPPTDDGPANLVQAGPLYAGETVKRIDDVLPAAQIVSTLAP